MEALTNLKGYLFERLARRTPCLTLAGGASGWSDSYTFNRYDAVREIMFWANTGKSTIVSKKELPSMDGYADYVLSIRRYKGVISIYFFDNLDHVKKWINHEFQRVTGDWRMVALELVGFKTKTDRAVLLDGWECPAWQKEQAGKESTNSLPIDSRKIRDEKPMHYSVAHRAIADDRNMEALSASGGSQQ